MSASTAVPEHPLIHRAWRERPGVPRGVAVLFYFAEAGEEAADRIDTGERELAARILAERHAARAEFWNLYGLPAQEMEEVFSLANTYAAHHEEYEDGEEVVYSAATRLLYHLGWMDGRTGAGQTVDEPLPLEGGADPTMPQIPDSTEQLMAGFNVQWRARAIFLPSYWEGWSHGSAARQLSVDAPAYLDSISEAAEVAATTAVAAMRTGADVFAPVRFFENATHRIGQAHLVTCDVRPALLDTYAEGVRFRLLMRLGDEYARNASHASGGVPSLAPVLHYRRVCRQIQAEELHEDDDFDPIRVLSLHARREALLLRLALLGLGPDAVGALEVRPCEEAYVVTSKVVRESPRVQELSRAARGALPHLVAGEGGRTPEQAGSLVLALPSGWSTPEELDIRNVRDALLSLPPETPLARQRHWLQDTEDRVLPEQRASARLLADRVARAMRCSPPPPEARSAYAAYEAQVAEEEGGDWVGAFRSVLAASVAARLAPAALECLSVPALWQALGEAEIAEIGGPADLEAAENWVRQYRREAERESGRAALELRARARIIETEIGCRALDIARQLVGESAPVAQPDQYSSPRAVARVRRAARRAKRSASRGLEVLAGQAPCLADRVRASIPLAVLEWVTQEVWVAQDLVAFLHEG